MVDAQSGSSPITSKLLNGLSLMRRSRWLVGRCARAGKELVGEAMAAALRSPFGVGDSQFHFDGPARDVESVYLGVTGGARSIG